MQMLSESSRPPSGGARCEGCTCAPEAGCGALLSGVGEGGGTLGLGHVLSALSLPLILEQRRTPGVLGRSTESILFILEFL